jgi:hypothetical protein
MAVPHQTLAPIRQLQGAHAGEIGLGLDLDGLREQLARTGAQDLGQGIVNRIRLTQADNVGSLIHGVSLFSKRFWQARHPPRYAAFLRPASPTFRHSSLEGFHDRGSFPRACRKLWRRPQNGPWRPQFHAL